MWLYQLPQRGSLFFNLNHLVQENRDKCRRVEWLSRMSSSLLPHVVPSLFTSSANELTVGKVYAALMIFDYYKQNRARRLQLQQQQSSSGSQVQHPEHTCPHTTHTDMHWSTHIPDGAVQTCTHAPTYITLAHTGIHSGCVSACIHTCKEGTFVSTSHSLVDYQRYPLLSQFNIFIIKAPAGWLPAKWATLMAFEPATAKEEPAFDCWLGV